MKIGFYDSGLGGVKTLKDILGMGLKEEIFFLADTKNRPYGTKSKELVKEIVRKNVYSLVDLGCEIIVIACNTATSVAIKELREELPNIDLIGTEPAVKIAIDENLNKRVLLIATTITVNGEKLNSLIEKLNAKDKVDLLATDELVMLIENQFFTNSKKEVNQYLESILNKYDLKQYSHIILGCTHFPLIKSNIEEILNKKGLNIKVIDGNQGIGKNLLKKIEGRNSNHDQLKIHILTTDENEVFRKRVKETLENIDYDYNCYKV